MHGNNALVGFALLIVVTVCAAFMPWGAFHVAVDTPLIEGASLPVTVKAFGGHVTLLGLIVPNWLATLLIASAAVLGMTNAKGITTIPRGIVLAPLLIAAAHCLLIAFLPIRGEGIPRLSLDEAEHLSRMQRETSILGAGLLVTLLSAACGAFMAMPVSNRALRAFIAPGKSRLWLTLVGYHLAAASYLLLIPAAISRKASVAPQGGVESESSSWGTIVLPLLVFAGLIELVAYGLHRRIRWVWVASLALTLFFLPPIFSSVFGLFELPIPLSFILGIVVIVYWGLLAPGTRAEFQPNRSRENPAEA